MTSIEIAKKAATDGAQLFRPRKDEIGQYDCKPMFTGSHKGWVIMDSFSANAIVAVWNAINDENRARYNRLNPAAMAKVAFKFVK